LINNFIVPFNGFEVFRPRLKERLMETADAA